MPLLPRRRPSPRGPGIHLIPTCRAEYLRPDYATFACTRAGRHLIHRDKTIRVIPLPWPWSAWMLHRTERA